MNSICVFCGASPGKNPIYIETAREVGRTLAAQGLRLVYGGGAVGTMGAVADACLESGGEVIGVITKRLENLEVGHTGLTSMHVVDTMHERKAMMAELADGFVSLPGGIGTMEELFEVFCWAQLEIHSKPCALLNVEGYYDQLYAFLQHMVDERFLLQEHGEMLLLGDDIQQLLTRMREFEPVKLEKWVDRKTSGSG
ncbi:MAG: TIGR00730 family Rossman fold protein [Verrucomicrobiota bacterium]